MFKKYFPFFLFTTTLYIIIGGLVLQYFMELEPCPMCIVQRYLWITISIISFVLIFKTKLWLLLSLSTSSILGVIVAARQSWLQLYPPDFPSCGRDIYGMIESFPLSRALPMIFKGSGDCSKIDWTLLGLSIANWSLLMFILFAVASFYLIHTKQRL